MGPCFNPASPCLMSRIGVYVFFFLGVQAKAFANPPIQVENLKKTVGTLSSQEFQGRAPGTRGHRLAQDYILNQLRSYGFAATVSKASSWQPWKGEIENIIAVKLAIKAATQPATPGKCIAFAAHYDHNPPMGGRYSPGANDNASGVAALLELARLMQTENLQLDADVYFTFPDQEENFIQGSAPLAEGLKRKCNRFLFSVTLDMVGVPFFSGFEKHLLVMGSESGYNLSNLVMNTASTRDQSLKTIQGDIFLIEPFGSRVPRSDYASFRKADVPFLFLTTGMPSTYHTPEDTLEHIDFELVKGTTQWMLQLLRMYSWDYQNREFGSRIGASEPTEQELYMQTQAVVEIMSLMLSRPADNALTASDIAFFSERIDAWKAYKKAPSKWNLQWAVIRLIEVVSRKSPVPAAYLRSLLGKLF